MCDKPLISIIIPCYNVGKYLPHCIKSLKSQNKSIPCEFIFINDGSTDDTKKILDSFAKEDNRVIVIDKTNEGVSAARNDGLKIAKGEYVYLVDGDDYLSDNAISIIARNIQEQEIDMLITNLDYDFNGTLKPYRHGLEVGIYSPKSLYDRCVKFPTPPQNIYRRNLIKEYNIRFDQNLKVGEVYEFTAQFLMYANRIKVSDDAIYYYVMHNQSATHKPNYQNDITVLGTIQKLYEHKTASWITSSSYAITAFKIATSFTYNKYILSQNPLYECLPTVKLLLENGTFKDILKVVAFKKHKAYKERLLALFIYYTGLSGFKNIKKIASLKHK